MLSTIHESRSEIYDSHTDICSEYQYSPYERLDALFKEFKIIEDLAKSNDIRKSLARCLDIHKDVYIVLDSMEKDNNELRAFTSYLNDSLSRARALNMANKDNALLIEIEELKQDSKNKDIQYEKTLRSIKYRSEILLCFGTVFTFIGTLLIFKNILNGVPLTILGLGSIINSVFYIL